MHITVHFKKCCSDCDEKYGCSKHRQIPASISMWISVEIYMKTEGVMVVTTAGGNKYGNTFFSKCLQQGDILVDHRKSTYWKEELVSGVTCARSPSLFILFANRNRLTFPCTSFRIQAERIVLVYGSKMMCRGGTLTYISEWSFRCAWSSN